MSHMGGYTLRLSFIWPQSKSMHRYRLGNLIYPQRSIFVIVPVITHLARPMREGPPWRRPFVNSSSRQVSGGEKKPASDDVLLVNRRRHELETVPPHHGLNVVRVSPEGKKTVAAASVGVGIIAKEGSTEAITRVDALSGQAVRAPAQVADDVVESRVVYVGPEKVTCDATNRRRRPGKARLPRRNGGASVSGEKNVAICGHRCGREHVLDRTTRRRGVKHRAVAAVSCLAAPWLRCWLRDRIPNRISVAGGEDGRRGGPRCAAIC